MICIFRIFFIIILQLLSHSALHFNMIYIKWFSSICFKSFSFIFEPIHLDCLLDSWACSHSTDIDCNFFIFAFTLQTRTIYFCNATFPLFIFAFHLIIHLFFCLCLFSTKICAETWNYLRKQCGYLKPTFFCADIFLRFATISGCIKIFILVANSKQKFSDSQFFFSLNLHEVEHTRSV